MEEQAKYTATIDVPEMYVRINIGQTSKGRNGETTVSLRGTEWTPNDLRALLRQSDDLLREEIARRERIDAACDGSNPDACSDAIEADLSVTRESRKVMS